MSKPQQLSAGVPDLIVVGEIDKVYDNSFAVSEYVKGKADKKLLINNFEKWECDKRPCKVEKGQRLCLFLHKQGTDEELESFKIQSKFTNWLYLKEEHIR